MLGDIYTTYPFENRLYKYEITYEDLLQLLNYGVKSPTVRKGFEQLINEHFELKQDLERANQKIKWLKTNQKAPSKEEIIAYETRQREVEKRQKNGKSNNNI